VTVSLNKLKQTGPLSTKMTNIISW